MPDSYPHAARRLRSDARYLASNSRFQNAGHFIGLAAECLVKETLQPHVKIDPASGLRVHFPTLMDRIRKKGHSRLMGKLLQILDGSDFLEDWNVELRYEQDIPVADAQARWEKWVKDVESLFRAAGIS